MFASAGRNSFRFPGSGVKSAITGPRMSRYFFECRNLTHARPCGGSVYKGGNQRGLFSSAGEMIRVGGREKSGNCTSDEVTLAVAAAQLELKQGSSDLMIVGGDTVSVGFPVGPAYLPDQTNPWGS